MFITLLDFIKPPNGLAFSCRERAAQDYIKKPTISRAKRSTATTYHGGP